MSESTTPKNVFQQDARTLAVEWEDGRTDQFEVRELRLKCSCAGCVHEWSGEKILEDSAVPEDVHPVNVESVGRYGLRIHWSDGHNTGIYTFDHLRSLGSRERE